MMSGRRVKLFSHVLAAVPLIFAAACGVDEKEEAASQEIGGNCTIQRPYGWDTTRHCCEAGPGPGPLVLGPGQSETFIARGDQICGVGNVTVTCNASGDGGWKESNKKCVSPHGRDPTDPF